MGDEDKILMPSPFSSKFMKSPLRILQAGFQVIQEGILLILGESKRGLKSLQTTSFIPA
jgi:hypothetical protein